jgi:predicted PurR-regulated permease PerM
MMYIPEEKTDNTKKILNRISKVAYQYLWGRAQVMLLLAIMYYITFSLFDLPYIAILIIFGTLITIIPYFGPFVSGLLPIIVAFIFFDSLEKALLFTAIIITVQLIESYVLEPLIIGKEVKLNPLVVIVAVVAGGAVWGIAGMVLFVPLFAIFQIISRYSSGLEPIGFLLGNSPKKE